MTSTVAAASLSAIPLVLLVAIAVVTISFGVSYAIADLTVHRRFVERAARFKAAAGHQPDAVVTEDDLRDLPEPMARHLRFSGALGKKRISALRLTHSGRFKPGVNRAWMPIHGEYYLTTKSPSFFWYGKIHMAAGVTAVALDSYADGAGRMLVKAMSLVTIVDERSTQISQSALGRCIAELATMTPTFFLDRDHVVCVQTGPDHVRCTLTDGALSTDADLVINADGALDRIVVMRYFDRGDGRATLERFTGTSSRPRTYAGRVLNSKMDGVWNLHEGDFHYVSFEVDAAAFE
jgi:hypothetical protein